jgi:cytochrome o ubiquinol oxidase subunit II
MRKRTKKRIKIVALLLPVLGIIALAAWYLHRTSIPVLEPAGQIGQKERNLMGVALLLSVIVVVPVYIMTIAIALKYRESNHQTKKVAYSPEWDHSRLFESIWWGIPIIIIAVLSVITWNSSHALDPYKPLASTQKPLTVQVVALDWKWLFVYPQQNVASVNLAEIPENTPVDFVITSDTVMNSFWIPQLGGQIYAMPGMSTQLHLEADKTGSFYGSSANISGEGFARMNFTARSVSGQAFNQWIASVKKSPMALDQTTYNRLAKPSTSNPVVYYSSVKDKLYDSIVVKYLEPEGTQHDVVLPPNLRGII